MQRRTSLFRTLCIVAVRNSASADEDLLPGRDYGSREELQYDGVVCQWEQFRWKRTLCSSVHLLIYHTTYSVSESS